jgi:Mrp family chromosome partitioning ATPase
MPSGPSAGQLVTHDPYEGSLTDEAEMAGLLSTLRSLIPNKQRCAIGVIATQAGEGVTTVSHGLAAAAARNPRNHVLLCSVPRGRQAVQAGRVQVTERGPARSPRLSVGQIDASLLSDLDVAVHGQQSMLVSTLFSTFDVAIVELPPLAEGRLGAALSRVLDGVLLVIEADRTRLPDVLATRRAVELHQGRVLGVVLNKYKAQVPSRIQHKL